MTRVLLCPEGPAMSEANAIRNAVKAVDDEMRRLRADLAEAKRLLKPFVTSFERIMPISVKRSQANDQIVETLKVPRGDCMEARAFLNRSTANDK